MPRILFDPLIPLSLWFPLLLIAVALLTWYGWSSRRRIAVRRRLLILALMGAALALPLGVLLNPTWIEPIPPPPGKPLLTILVDQSASMEVRDASTGRTRYEEAAELAAEATKRFTGKYDVRLFGFDRELRNTSPEELASHKPEGASTDLSTILEQSFDSDQTQGQILLLFSDGVNNHGTLARLRETLSKAKATATPVFARTFAGSSDIDDLELELGLPQEIAFASQQIPVTVHLRRRGTSTETAHVSLKLEDQLVEQRDVEISGNGTAETIWMVSQPKSGLYRYEIQVNPLPGEVTVVNNTATLLLRVVDEPVRVLLLEGKPYWDTKYLVRTLSADPSIELTSVVRVAEERLHRRKIVSLTSEGQENKKDEWTIETQPDRFLAEAGELDRYQIVVLGRDAEIFFSETALVRLKKWLTEGNGSLVCFRGAPTSQINERLAQLLPVRWEPSQESRFRSRMTPAGLALRWLPSGGTEDPLSGMPSLASVTTPGVPKPLAVILASTEDQDQSAPVITYQPVGSGRVVVVEGAGMWRWAFLPPTYQDRDETYAALWRSLVRWLVSNVGLLPSQDMALRTDTTVFSTDETATAMLWTREDRVGSPPEIELSGGMMDAPRRLAPVSTGAPGLYRLVFGRLPEGHYRANVTGVANKDDVAGVVEFDVRGNLKERLDVVAQPEIMRMIAENSGGTEFTGDDWMALSRDFDEHLARIHPPRNTQTPAWDRWWVFVAVMTFWAASWTLRRSSGLV